MFYRVDYAAAVLLAGFLAGLLCSRKTESISPARLAGGYYRVVALLLVLRTAIFVGTMLASHQATWNKAGGLTGDVISLLFGALFGLALRRRDGREFLLHRDILAALCVTLAFGFATVALGKAFSMTPMTEFFTQSGYSIPFLKFIIIAEVFGAIGLLLPWGFVPAMLGLAIDMFGAVLTHVHNGDPLNDSTGAIVNLIRLAVVGVLWMLRPRDEAPARDLRGSLLRVGGAAVVCLLIAVGGSSAMRHGGSPSANISPAAR